MNFNEVKVAKLVNGSCSADGLAFDEVPIDANFTRPDLEGVRAFVPYSDSGSAVLDGWLPEYTFVSGANATDPTAGTIVFVAAGDQEVLQVTYHAQPTDSTRGDFEDGRAELVDSDAVAQASLGIPEIDLELKSIPIVANTSKLKAVRAPEWGRDFTAYRSIVA